MECDAPSQAHVSVNVHFADGMVYAMDTTFFPYVPVERGATTVSKHPGLDDLCAVSAHNGYRAERAESALGATRFCERDRIP